MKDVAKDEVGDEAGDVAPLGSTISAWFSDSFDLSGSLTERSQMGVAFSSSHALADSIWVWS